MKKNIIAALEFGIITGFLASLGFGLPEVLTNKYFQFGLFNTACRLLNASFMNYIPIGIALCLVLSLVLSIGNRIKISQFRTLFKYSAISSWLFGIYRLSGIDNLFSLENFILEMSFKISVIVIFVSIGLFIVFRIRNGKEIKQPPVFISNLFRESKPIKYLSISCVLIFLTTFISSFVFSNRVNIRAKSKPNVIFIMIDTLRADHLGCYGYKYNTSPNIDKFANSATRFARVFSQAPWTTWSVCSFMTSQYPDSMSLGTPKTLKELNNKYLTLSEILRDNGYDTFAVVSNPMVGKSENFNQGFNQFKEMPGLMFKCSDEVYDYSSKFISKFTKPSFMFSLFVDAHAPYEFKKEFAAGSKYEPIAGSKILEKKLKKAEKELPAYDSEIKYTDYYIGKLLDDIKKNGLYDKSLIIVMADHGEEFLDHGSFGHEKTLYNEIISVPLIVKLPNQKNGRVVDGTFSLIDLLPSILGELKIGTGKYNFKGVDANLAKVIKVRDKLIYFATDTSRISLNGVYSKPNKLIVDIKRKSSQLYNLDTDVLELINTAKTNTTVTNDLTDRLNAHQIINEPAFTGSGAKAKFSDKEKERLKTLGYLAN